MQSNGHYRLDGDSLVFSDEATDEDLAVLDSLPHLKSIGFSRGPNVRPPIRVTAAGLAHLASVKELEKLKLSGVPLTDAGLAPVATLHGLRELWLDGNEQLTDAALKHVAGLTKLRVLRFFKTPLTDDGLLRIRNLLLLEDLQLGYAQITDATAATIMRFAELRTLDLQHTGITNAGLASLRGMTKLRWVAVRETAVSDLAPLAGLAELEWLTADHTAVNDASLAHLARLARLHDVDLSSTKVTDAGLPGRTPHQRCGLEDGERRRRSLVARPERHEGHRRGPAEPRAALEARPPRSRCCAIGDEGLAVLASLKSLKGVSLANTRITRAAYDATHKAHPDLGT